MLYLWFRRVEVKMDEYDELFEIEDKFEDQFADELEVLASMEEGENERANKCYISLIQIG